MMDLVLLALFSIVATSGRGAAEATTLIALDVEECLADPANEARVEQLLRLTLEMNIWNIPLLPPDSPPTRLRVERSLNWEIPFLGSERFEWFANVLPSGYDAANEKKIEGLPPPAWWGHQLFPLWNFQRAASDWGYRKWPAFQAWVMAFVGVDPDTATSDLNVTIFAKNLEDRGPNNQVKRQYLVGMSRASAWSFRGRMCCLHNIPLFHFLVPLRRH